MQKILLVEDSRFIREEIRDILFKENFEVLEAGNGMDGLKTSIKLLPDLIISDILMPLLNGFEFIHEIRKNRKTMNIPVIFLSSKTDLTDIRKGINLGADDYLTKPICPDDLILAIKRKLNIKLENEKKLNLLKSQISQYMPHELITPLNGILGFSEYLNQNSYLSEEEIRMAANSIHSCGQRLNKLIQNYLLFTQLLVEYNTPEKNHLSGNQLPLETIELIEKICWTVDESRKDDLVMDLKPARIKISRNDFTRVIEELVGNALKFSAKGLKINISSKIEQGYYFLKIENFGKGITRQQIDEIGAFVQFNRQKTEQQGLGLGLEIVKLLISLNGGNIKFNSRENEFFKVKIQFPVS